MVVCVGGFGDSPAAFDPLVERLRKEDDVCVTLPPTPGWDRWDGFRKARQLSYVDWKIACRRAICEANALGEEVRQSEDRSDERRHRASQVALRYYIR